MTCSNAVKHTVIRRINGREVINCGTDWPTALEQSGVIRDVTLQHGVQMKTLEVRLCQADDDTDDCNACVAWLMKRTNTEDAMLVGLDAEGGKRSGHLHVIQVSTSTRCVLFQVRPNALPVALQRLLEDATIFKAGAEIWTDAVDIWSLSGVRTNGCLDVNATENLQQRKHGLESLCNELVGADAFIKDKVTTCSDWGTDRLTLRQIVYAALDAQASWYAGRAVLEQMPTPAAARGFDLAGCSVHLLQSLVQWKSDLRAEETDQEDRDRLVVDQSLITPVEGAPGRFVVRMTRYQTRIRARSQLHVRWKDGTATDATVVRIDGCCATIKCTGCARVDADQVLDITLSRCDEKNMTAALTASHVLGQLARGAVHSSVLRAVFGLESTPPLLTPGIDADSDVLDVSQRQVIAMTDRCHVGLCQGPPGTGKTATLAIQVARLVRANQRVWCVAATNMAARNIAAAIRKHVDALHLVLGVSSEYYTEWHESLYADLLASDCICTDARKLPDRQVVVTTLGFALSALKHSERLGVCRSTLIVDEASQLAALEGVLLLEALPDIQRLTLIGDEAQLPPHGDVASVQQLFAPGCGGALLTARGFQTDRCMLQTQYRMPAGIGTMISRTFYDGLVRNHRRATAAAKRRLDIGAYEMQWIDVPAGKVSRDGTSLRNQVEVDTIERECQRLMQQQHYKPCEIVVLSFYEAQTALLKKRLDSLLIRACNVDSFQGQEAKVVILSLTANKKISGFLDDKRRVNVACSRAQERLVVVGNRTLCQTASASVWSRVQSHFF